MVAAALAAATSFGTRAVPAAACRPATGPGSQLITVEAPRYAVTHASVRLWRRAGSCWVAAGGPWSARIGRGGLSDHHVEGDGTTPTGTYGLGPVIYGIAPDPGVHYRYHRLVCGDYWNEDPASPGYNTFQHIRCGATPPFRQTGGGLWTATIAYQHFVPIRYNTDPAVPGRGSAIFLHDDWGSATHGCIAIAPAHLDTVLRWLRPSAKPQIVIGTRAEIVSSLR